MSSSRQFAIMSLHGGQKYYHEVCTNYLSHSAISSIVSGMGSRKGEFYYSVTLHRFGRSSRGPQAKKRVPLIKY